MTNLSLINNDVARKIGLPSDTVNINLNVAGGRVVTRHAKEVSFQLVNMNKSFVSKSMYAITTSSVGNPFNIIDFNPERHAYLEGFKFADKYPSTGGREFEMIVSEPYFSELERAEEVKSPKPKFAHGEAYGTWVDFTRSIRGFETTDHSLGVWCARKRARNVRSANYLRIVVFRFRKVLEWRERRYF